MALGCVIGSLGRGLLFVVNVFILVFNRVRLIMMDGGLFVLLLIFVVLVGLLWFRKRVIGNVFVVRIVLVYLRILARVIRFLSDMFIIGLGLRLLFRLLIPRFGFKFLFLLRMNLFDVGNLNVRDLGLPLLLAVLLVVEDDGGHGLYEIGFGIILLILVGMFLVVFDFDFLIVMSSFGELVILVLVAKYVY